MQYSLEWHVVGCWQLVILLTDEVAEPHLLWDQFKAGLCDDVKHKLHYMNHYQADQEIPEDDVYDYGLWDLNRILVAFCFTLSQGWLSSYFIEELGSRRRTL